MVGRMVLRWSLIAVALLGVRTVAAAPITFTGNVAADFNPQTNPGVVVIPNPLSLSQIIADVAQPAYMTQSGLISGFAIKDVALDYNPSTDTMYVGVNTYGIAGNVDGTGAPGTVSSSYLAATGGAGTNPADWAGAKSLVVGFAPISGNANSTSPVAPVLVAGIPGNVNQLGPGLDGFNLSKYVPPGGTGSPSISLFGSFGPTLTSGLGGLAFQPSAQNPGFEFSITNFSQLLGANPLNGVALTVEDGMIGGVGKNSDVFQGTFPEPQELPEPTTWMVWAGMAGGLAWARYRRSRRARP